MGPLQWWQSNPTSSASLLSPSGAQQAEQPHSKWYVLRSCSLLTSLTVSPSCAHKITLLQPCALPCETMPHFQSSKARAPLQPILFKHWHPVRRTCGP